MKKIKILVAILLLIPILFVPIKLMSLGKKVEKKNLQLYLFNKQQDPNSKIRLGFYGTTCFTVDYKGSTYLNDPFFSNPGYYQLLTGEYPNRKELIEPILKNIDSIQMITITHGHYDHCLDFPSFEDKFTYNAKLISSSSTLLSLSPYTKNHDDWRQYQIERMSKVDWIYSADSVFRVLPIKSIHQPHIGKIKFFQGNYTSALNEAPGPVWQWKEGYTYSFLLDVMDNGKIVERLLIASGEFPESSLAIINEQQKEKQIDIMCSPYWHKEKSGTALNAAYQSLHPKKVLLHHWNNFFRSPTKEIQMIRSSDIENEVNLLRSEGLPVSIMMPFTEVNI